MSDKVHYETLQIAPALNYLDKEARYRGHCVSIQEIYLSGESWFIRAWVRGNEEFDALYENLFRQAVVKKPLTPDN